jgi:hypothetical protein
MHLHTICTQRGSDGKVGDQGFVNILIER